MCFCNNFITGDKVLINQGCVYFSIPVELSVLKNIKEINYGYIVYLAVNFVNPAVFHIVLVLQPIDGFQWLF